MKPSLLIIIALVCGSFWVVFFSCKKSTHIVIPITTINIDSLIQPLAGSKVFFMACNPAPSGTGCLSYSSYTDSIIILNDSTIYLRNENMAMRLLSDTAGKLVFTCSGTGDWGQLLYRPGSDTIYFGYNSPAFSAGGSGCNGFCLNNLKNNPPYNFSYPPNYYLYIPVTFTSNAPANSTFIWLFGDGTSSTLASPTHVFHSCDGMVALVINNNLPIVKHLALNLNLQSLTGTKTWRVTKQIISNTTDTTYNLNDTAFGFTYINNDTLSVLGMYLSRSAYNSYFWFNITPDYFGLSDSSHTNTMTYNEPSQSFNIVYTTSNSTQTTRTTYSSP